MADLTVAILAEFASLWRHIIVSAAAASRGRARVGPEFRRFGGLSISKLRSK